MSETTAEAVGRAAAEFRPIIAAGFVGGALIAGGIGVAERGLGSWVCIAISICVLATGYYRLRKERALLSGRVTTVATVTEWKRTEGIEGGHSYSVGYRFFGEDGRVYVGKSGSTSVELPREGELLPISYRRGDPNDNLPLATFWFYRFTYTGFSKWM